MPVVTNFWHWLTSQRPSYQPTDLKCPCWVSWKISVSRWVWRNMERIWIGFNRTNPSALGLSSSCFNKQSCRGLEPVGYELEKLGWTCNSFVMIVLLCQNGIQNWNWLWCRTEAHHTEPAFRFSQDTVDTLTVKGRSDHLESWRVGLHNWWPWRDTVEIPHDSQWLRWTL